MRTPTHARDRKQPWCLYGLAGSPAEVRESERRLARERGHEPKLYEVIEDLMARQHLAAPFTAPSASPLRTSRGADEPAR